VRVLAGKSAARSLQPSRIQQLLQQPFQYYERNLSYRGIVSQDERPEDEERRDELAAFDALGGRLTWEELARLLGYRDEQALSCALHALPERQRQAVVLRKYTGLSEQQAAKEMRISNGAVRSHLARGMLTLRHPAG
jgi:RNA polymerase sigma factor (sigma-70 family)